MFQYSNTGSAIISNEMPLQIKLVFILVLATLLLGCGGGGSSSVAPIPSIAAVADQPDVADEPDIPDDPVVLFEPSANFIAACEVPRVGIDPFTGLPFPDSQGSTLQENQWLRSWSNEFYLWYDEIIDQDPALFSDTLSYFDTLKTLATTPSGNLRDNFHFTIDTEEWNQLSQSGLTSGYGASFILQQPSIPRDMVVAFVEPGSPAANAGLLRGTRVIAVDGADAINGNAVDTLNAGLFPTNSGELHNFVVRHIGASSDSIIQMTSEDLESIAVPSTQVISTATGNVGYILFNQHIATAEQQLIDAVSQLQTANASDLVLDLRYNGGGFLAIAAQMGYMIAGSAATQDRTFELQTFNDKNPVFNPFTGDPIEALPFYSESLGFSTTPGQALPSLDLPRVYILTSSSTCSASESIINALRGINVEVIQIGTTTCGKPYGFLPQDNCGTTYFSIHFSGENDISFGDYSDGFSPQNTVGFIGVPVTGCSVADDFSNELGDPQESLLAAALLHRSLGSCPTSPVLSSKAISIQLNTPEFSSPTVEAIFREHSVGLQNRILGIPR